MAELIRRADVNADIDIDETLNRFYRLWLSMKIAQGVLARIQLSVLSHALTETFMGFIRVLLRPQISPVYRLCRKT